MSTPSTRPRTAAEDIEEMKRLRASRLVRRPDGKFAGWLSREQDSFHPPEEFSADPAWDAEEFEAVTGARIGQVHAPVGSCCPDCGGEQIIEPDGSAFHLDAAGQPSGCPN